MPHSAFAPEVNVDRGFLPVQDPLIRLPKPFDAWESVATNLPKFLASDQLRRTIAELQQLLAPQLFPFRSIA